MHRHTTIFLSSSAALLVAAIALFVRSDPEPWRIASDRARDRAFGLYDLRPGDFDALAEAPRQIVLDTCFSEPMGEPSLTGCVVDVARALREESERRSIHRVLALVLGGASAVVLAAGLFLRRRRHAQELALEVGTEVDDEADP